MALLTDDLRIAFQEGEKQGRRGEQLKIANNYRNWNPHGSINEDGDAYQDYRRPPQVPGELPDRYRGPVFGVEEDGQMFFDFVRQLQINPEIAGALLPGERSGSSTGGLKGMKPSDVERYLNENNITGPAADKIWKKYKGLQGDIGLPLAQISPKDTPRDLRIQDAVKKYGKDPKTGEYIDPTLLIKHLLKA